MRTLFTLLIAASIGAGVAWQVKSRQDLVERDRIQTESAHKIKDIEKSLTSEKRRNQTDILAQQAVVDRIKSLLAIQKENSAAARQRLEVSRNKGQPDGVAGSEIQDKLRNQQDLIAEIETQIRGIKVAEANLGNQGKIAQSQQRAELAQQNSQWLDQIHAQEQIIADTQQRIQNLKRKHEDYDWRDQVKQLEMQLREQNSQLKQLRDLRPKLAAQGSLSQSELDAQVKQEKSNILLSQVQMEERLRQEKLVYADLKRQLDETHRTQNAAKTDLSRLRADAETENGKVKTLETQLQAEEARLREMLK